MTTNNDQTNMSVWERHTLEIKRDKPPVKLADILTAMGISGPKVAAKDLIDQTFTILHAKPFESSFKAESEAYFCVVKLDDDDAVITTVLGGAAVVDILKALGSAGFDSPLTVTLRWNSGGKFSGYYTLE